jgi:periodic tryptophan protein 1
MITALAWIPKGAAREKPVRFELSNEEYSRIRKLATVEEDTTIQPSEANGFEGGEDNEDKEVDISELPAELRMDDYDNEDDEVMERKNELDDEDETDEFSMIEQGDIALAQDEESDEEDAEDDEIKTTDALLVVAMTEDDYSHLEVHLLSEDGQLFVHHDISLPDFPLCLAWMDCPPFQADGGQIAIGNYMAVGTFNPTIEIWNLDVLDPLEPTASLGGPNDSKPSKKSGKNRSEWKEGSHSDAVMGLSWNTVYRQALASSSADTSVKIWDVTTQSCSHTFTHHTDKVQCVQWHPSEAWLLASGSFDKTITLSDCRTGNLAASYAIDVDVESMTWDPFNPFHLYTSLEDGQIVCIDVRKKDAPLFSFEAHDETTSSISFSSSIPGMLSTCSIDKTVKVWDVGNVQHKTTGALTSAPNLIAYKSMNVGKLFALSYYHDDPFMLAAAGDKGVVAIWESDEQDMISNHFKSRIQEKGSVYSGITGSNSSDSSKISELMSSSGSVVAAPKAPTDDSWMDEDDQVVEKDKKKKKDKKKSKK